MSELGGLHTSLETMNFAQLVLAFIAVIGYALALNGSIGGRSRGLAGVAALTAAAAFAASMSQWTDGVMLMALVVAAMGLFVGIAWFLSAICGLGGGVPAEPDSVLPEAAPGPDTAAVGREPSTALRPREPHGSHAHSA